MSSATSRTWTHLIYGLLMRAEPSAWQGDWNHAPKLLLPRKQKGQALP